MFSKLLGIIALAVIGMFVGVPNTQASGFCPNFFLGHAKTPIITSLPYTIGASDECLTLVFNSATPGAINIPAPAGSFTPSFYVAIQNIGAGTLTLTPSVPPSAPPGSGTAPTINGNATLAVTTGGNALLASGSDGNWYATTSLGASGMNTSASNAVLPAAPNNLLANPIGANISTSGTLATTNTTVSTSATTGALTVAGGLGVGGAINANGGLASFNFVDPTTKGAACNGVTDDSATFQSLATAGNDIILPYNKTCLISNLSLGTSILNLNGGKISASAAGNPVVVINGSNSRIVGPGVIDDPNNLLLISTTSSVIANPGDSTITVTNGSGFGQYGLVAIALDSGAHWVTEITSITTGTTLHLLDPIPYSATAATVSTGGTGCSTGDTAILAGSTGPPTTFLLTVTAGVVSAVTIEAPGLMTVVPANAASVTAGSINHCTVEPTLTVTYRGAASGNIVKASQPTVLVNSAYNPKLNNLTISGQLPLEIAGNGTQTTNWTISNLFITGTLAGIYINGNVNTGFVSNAIVYGPSITNWGYQGIYVSETSGVVEGNTFVGIKALQWENGGFLAHSINNTFVSPIFDTNRNYGLIINAGSGNALIGQPQTTYTYGTGTGFMGIGLLIYNTSTYNSVENLLTSGNTLSWYVDNSSAVGWTAPGNITAASTLGNSAYLSAGPSGSDIRLFWYSPTQQYLIAAGNSNVTLQTNANANIATYNGTSFSINVPTILTSTTLPTQAAGTLGLGGIAAVPTLAANGEGDAFLTTTGGLNLIGQGSTNDFTLLNKAGVTVASVPTGTTTFTLPTLNATTAVNDNGTAPTGVAGSGYVRANSPTITTPSFVGAKVVQATKTANYTILTTDSGTYFDNTGALGAVIFTLPAYSAGLRYCFQVTAAQTIEVLAPAATNIAVGTANSAAAGNIQNGSVYSSICLVATSVSNQWAADRETGFWATN